MTSSGGGIHIPGGVAPGEDVGGLSIPLHFLPEFTKIGKQNLQPAHTATFSIIFGIVAAIGLLLFTVYEEWALMGEWPLVGWIFLTAIPVAGIGYVVGAVLIWMILGGIAARIQGWPFVTGDEVVILAGKDRGRVTKVYEVWESRGQVRLELGDEAKESVTDVYCAVAVTRTNNTEHGDGKPDPVSS